MRRDTWSSRGIALGMRRLSIVGLADGQQPMYNEDRSLRVVFNGELFDHAEKRAELEARGHRFRTHCDTEILPHLWEEHGEGIWQRLRGQFAIAMWDAARRRLQPRAGPLWHCAAVLDAAGGLAAFCLGDQGAAGLGNGAGAGGPARASITSLPLRRCRGRSPVLKGSFCCGLGIVSTSLPGEAAGRRRLRSGPTGR